MLIRATVLRNHIPKMKAMRILYHQSETRLNLLSIPERKRVVQFIRVITALLLLMTSTSAFAQLGVYNFTGTGACPIKILQLPLNPVMLFSVIFLQLKRHVMQQLTYVYIMIGIKTVLLTLINIMNSPLLQIRIMF